ncbi:MAG: molybdopterin dinucleotide binding domain-containing protein, partial [Terriglobales bacterium]
QRGRGGPVIHNAKNSIHSLYDVQLGPLPGVPNAPLPGPVERAAGASLDWNEADQEIAAALRRAGRTGVLLTGTVHGPARRQLIADFCQTFGMRHVVYDAFNADAVMAGQAASYGEAATPRYFFERVEMLVTFGGDPLGSGPSRQEHSRGFGRQRKLRPASGGDFIAASDAARKSGYGGQRMSRVVAFEPAMTMTGLNADTRYLLRPEQLIEAALGLAHQLVVIDKRSNFAGNGTVAAALAPFAPATVEPRLNLAAGTLQALAAELWAHRGEGLIYAGGLPAATTAAAELEAVASFLNSALGNEGATVEATRSPSQQAQGSNLAMLELVEDMRAGKVGALVIHGTNPAYTLPAAADFAGATAKVPFIVAMAERLDETGRLSDLVLTSLHGMESWGDAEPQRGLYSVIQPTILPLFDGRAFEDSLIAIARAGGSKQFEMVVPTPPAPAPAPVPAGVAAPAAPAGAQAQKAAAPAGKAAAAAVPAAGPKMQPMTFHDYLQAVWKKQICGRYQLAGTWEDFWTGVLRQGVFDPDPNRLQPGAARAYRPAALAAAARAAQAAPAAPSEGEMVLALADSPMVGDGWCNNNGFLLETADPVAKVCWDNFISISPGTAQKLGLAHGDVVEIVAGGAKLRAPIQLQPGVHPQVATIAVGWGRATVGAIGNGVGVNAYPLAAVEGGRWIGAGQRVRLTKVGSGYNLAEPQGNNYLQGRAVALATSFAALAADPTAGNVPPPPDDSLWHNGGASDHPYKGHHWGMTIDLNACIGCNACMVACHAENNVPVVGREQVQAGREMHWIRIDRYYTGEFENPDVINEPMLCQQCANASCESVCPVIATITDSEGINVQVYNRCVGTRFCSNNCPYKVRRFNFFDYAGIQYQRGAPLELALNPDVTMRSRGVMEKCNFCLQRINDAHVKAQKLGVPIPDGGIKTACQQTCPTEAIYFGDMNDPKSRMMRARAPRGFEVLAGLNNQPTITYLVKVRNAAEEHKA